MGRTGRRGRRRPVAATVSMKDFTFQPATSRSRRQRGAVDHDGPASDPMPNCESPQFQPPARSVPRPLDDRIDKGPDGKPVWDSGVTGRRLPVHPHLHHRRARTTTSAGSNGGRGDANNPVTHMEATSSWPPRSATALVPAAISAERRRIGGRVATAPPEASRQLAAGNRLGRRRVIRHRGRALLITSACGRPAAAALRTSGAHDHGGRRFAGRTEAAEALRQEGSTAPSPSSRGIAASPTTARRSRSRSWPVSGASTGSSCATRTATTSSTSTSASAWRATALDVAGSSVALDERHHRGVRRARHRHRRGAARPAGHAAICPACSAAHARRLSRPRRSRRRPGCRVVVVGAGFTVLEASRYRWPGCSARRWGRLWPTAPSTRA